MHSSIKTFFSLMPIAGMALVLSGCAQVYGQIDCSKVTGRKTVTVTITDFNGRLSIASDKTINRCDTVVVKNATTIIVDIEGTLNYLIYEPRKEADGYKLAIKELSRSVNMTLNPYATKSFQPDTPAEIKVFAYGSFVEKSAETSFDVAGGITRSELDDAISW